jgi:UPF0716 protein FxsA
MIVLLLLILWPVAELFVIVVVAESIGILLTLLLLIVGWPLGSWAIRSQGRAVLGRMAARLHLGRVRDPAAGAAHAGSRARAADA